MEKFRKDSRAGRRIKLLGAVAFAAGSILLAGLVAHAGLAPLAAAISALGLTGLLVIALVHLPVIGLLGGAWYLISRGSRHPGFFQFAWARGVRDAGAEALPFSQVGGYMMGARALSLFGVGGRSALNWTFIDLLIEFAAKLPYVLLGLALLELSHPSSLGAAAFAGLAALTIFVASRAPMSVMHGAMRLLPLWRSFVPLRRWVAGAAGIASSKEAVWRGSFALHLACWVLGAAETWLIFRLMHMGVSSGSALIIDSLVGAIRALSFFMPGAIGVQEGGYVLLCGLFGISPAAALTLSFARRARDLLIAIPFLASWQWRETQILWTSPPRVGS